jgi:hypothetical protein
MIFPLTTLETISYRYCLYAQSKFLKDYDLSDDNIVTIADAIMFINQKPAPIEMLQAA